MIKKWVICLCWQERYSKVIIIIMSINVQSKRRWLLWSMGILIIIIIKVIITIIKILKIKAQSKSYNSTAKNTASKYNNTIYPYLSILNKSQMTHKHNARNQRISHKMYQRTYYLICLLIKIRIRIIIIMNMLNSHKHIRVRNINWWRIIVLFIRSLWIRSHNCRSRVLVILGFWMG